MSVINLVINIKIFRYSYFYLSNPRKWFQSLNSDYTRVCIDPYSQFFRHPVIIYLSIYILYLTRWIYYLFLNLNTKRYITILNPLYIFIDRYTYNLSNFLARLWRKIHRNVPIYRVLYSFYFTNDVMTKILILNGGGAFDIPTPQFFAQCFNFMNN